MKTIIQILALSSLIPLATAAGEGYITTFTVPACGQVDGPGGVGQRVETDIPVKTCVNLALFTSFQGGLANACPKGKTPEVTAYTAPKCAGTAVGAGTIPLDYEDGPCQEIVIETATGVSAGGQSASFACV